MRNTPRSADEHSARRAGTRGAGEPLARSRLGSYRISISARLYSVIGGSTTSLRVGCACLAAGWRSHAIAQAWGDTCSRLRGADARPRKRSFARHDRRRALYSSRGSTLGLHSVSSRRRSLRYAWAGRRGGCAPVRRSKALPGMTFRQAESLAGVEISC